MTKNSASSNSPLKNIHPEPSSAQPREIQQAAKRPVALITGASSGIGAAAVAVFAAAGYDVVLTARRKERLEQVRAAVAARRPDARILPLLCDVDKDESVSEAFKQVAEQFGRLDALVNNAGFGSYGSVEKSPPELFRSSMETNYFGVIRCTQAALPLLRAAATDSKRRWGAGIVMVSSFVGRRALPLMSAYCASKFALEGFSESLRVELRDERISVSVVNPGVTRSEFIGAAQGERPKNFLSPEGGMSCEAVAEVLLKAVRRPRRNFYLTAAGQSGLALQWLAPALMDRVALRVWRQTQAKG
jgi:short-subunit dehydrogenase